ncbi:hypothetical protein [Paenibacillus fonticola]|uniref:hypothetical protein n=1 Tax=Paenibacillus fonticola TaxID=379896 RepID=UPI00037A47B1|nr:hypothetical protein [Paenibacillus fonticola]
MQALQVLRNNKKLMVSTLLALAGAAVLVVLFIFKPWAAKAPADEPIVFIRDNLLMMMKEDEQQPTELSGPLPKEEMGI